MYKRNVDMMLTFSMKVIVNVLAFIDDCNVLPFIDAAAVLRSTSEDLDLTGLKEPFQGRASDQ